MSGAVAIAVEQTTAIANAAPSESAAILSMIERASKDPTVDIDKMQRLYEMMERVEKRRAEQAFNSAMADAQSKIRPVIRNKENLHTKSKYADLYAIADAAMPTIHSAGFGLSFSTEKANLPGCIGMVLDVTHSAGFSKIYRSDVPLDDAGAKGTVNKTPVQAFGSTTTYGRRYMIVMAFNLPITDRDGNAAKPAAAPAITEKQAADLRDGLLAKGIPDAEVCSHFKIASLEEMPSNLYDAALKTLARSATRV